MSKDIIGYMEDTLDNIRTFELVRLEWIIEEFKKTKRLCSYAGQLVVAEFGFTGDKQEVEAKLQALYDRYDKEGLTDADRIILCKNQENLMAFHRSESDDPYRKTMVKNITDIDNVMNLANRLNQRKEELHKKKECLCYSNKSEEKL